MGGRAVLFRQADIKRAVKGASAGGMQVGRAEIEPSGKIVLIAKGEAAEPEASLNKWMKDHAGKT